MGRVRGVSRAALVAAVVAVTAGLSTGVGWAQQPTVTRVGCAPGNPTLAAAVAAAPAGGTVEVCRGVYPGGLQITKPITLRGAQAGRDARTGRTDPGAESVIDAGGGTAISVAPGVSRVTIDGFTLRNPTQSTGPSTGGVLAFGNGSGITITNNVITRFSFGVNMNSNGAIPSAVTRNRFVENNGAGGQAGVFLCCGPANNLAIENNLFTGHSGDAAAAVNTAGDPANLSRGLRIERNRSVDDSTFAVVVNADRALVSRNEVVRSPQTATAPGTAILVGGRTTGVLVERNTIRGGDRNGITVYDLFGNGVGNTGTVVERNDVTGRSNGIRFVAQKSGTISRNTVVGGTGTGILLEGANSGVLVERNQSVRNVTLDCADQSTGSGIAGTANSWTRNTGLRSTPVGLCPPG